MRAADRDTRRHGVAAAGRRDRAAACQGRRRLCRTLDGTKIATVANRMEAMRARYGDRFAETPLDTFVRSKDKLPTRSNFSCCGPSRSTAIWRTLRPER